MHCFRNCRKAEKLRDKFGNDSRLFAADLSNSAAVSAMMRDVENWRSRLHLIVNAAGITHESPLLRTSPDDFDRVTGANLTAAFNLIRFGAPLVERGGHIVNISSYSAVKGKAGLSAYAASKSALIGLSLSAARELAEHGVCVNVLLPGYMLTEMGQSASEQSRQDALRDNLFHQYSDPAATARFIAWLAGEPTITGQVFNLDGRVG